MLPMLAGLQAHNALTRLLQAYADRQVRRAIDRLRWDREVDRVVPLALAFARQADQLALGVCR